jgi:hypothetical protein
LNISSARTRHLLGDCFLRAGVRFDRRAFARQRRLVRFQRRFCRLQSGVAIIEVHHVDEDLLLDPADLGLGGADLMLHRVIFVVGLDRHQLLFVFAEPLLGRDQILVERPPMRLIVGDGLFRLRHLVARRRQPGVEGGNLDRRFRDVRLRLRRARFNFL